MTEINKSGTNDLFEEHKKVFPARVKGKFRSLKWKLLILFLSIYYFLPFIRWERGEGLPNQAVLIDTASRKFYFFFIEVWPQEVFIFTGLLALAAITLFFVTSILGRIWCGYACPQTIWTDLFIAVERFFEGDRVQRIRLQNNKLSFNKIWRKTLKHLTWLLISVFTGGAFILYFTDAPTFFKHLSEFQISYPALFWISTLTLSTYILAGFAREHVCTYMCPYARFQGSMFDEDTMIVSFDEKRGEPRGKVSNKNAGDCIDCNRCVAVCPTGIDIRNGQQYQCINCALCIDACNDIMQKVKRPTGLIKYDTLTNINARAKGLEGSKIRIMRPRSIIYLTLILTFSALIIYTLSAGKKMIDINVIRDRNPMYIQLSNGDIRNAYRVHILNKYPTEQKFTLSVEGVKGAVISTSHQGSNKEHGLIVNIKASDIGDYRLFVDIPKNNIKAGNNKIKFVVIGEKAQDIYDGIFIAPK